jgi:hypothetical protein
MLVVGYYHYPCQGVISFVLGWAAVWRRVNPAGTGHVGFWRKAIFFKVLKKAWIPAFAWMTEVWREDFFVAEGSLCAFLVTGTGKLMRIQGMADKICQFGPIFGPKSANP